MNWKRHLLHPAGFCLAFLLAAASPCLGQVGSNEVDYGVHPLPFSRTGSAGWQFLKLPTDARSAAMGGIRSATGFGSANSAFTNPASSADVKGMDVQFTSLTWVADIKYSSAAFVTNLGQWGSIGVSGMYVNYGDMIRTEVAEGFGPAGNSLGIMPITEGLGTFTAHDLAFGVVYARRVTDFLQVGGTLRYCEEQLDDAKMTTWSLDLGTMYWTGIGSLRISMLGKNFGPDGQFLAYEGRVAQSPAKVRLPMEFIIGAAYDILPGSEGSAHRLTAAAEYIKPNDGPDKYHVGVEYFAFSNIYLRGGYRFNYDEASYSFGMGVEYAVADEVALKFDYAYQDLGRFEGVHELTFGFGF